MPIPFCACMVAAAAAFHLPVRALPAIQRAEGGYIGAVMPNTDGSHDLGLMQVNTRWIGPLSEGTGLPRPTVATRLILDPCFNIAAAAAILRRYVDEERGNVWQAIGDYHSHTPGLNMAYKFRVLREVMALPLPPLQTPAHHKRKAPHAHKAKAEAVASAAAPSADP